MPVPTAITDLSTTPASNYPAGTEAPNVIDDTLRAHAAFIRENYNRLTDGTDPITCAALAATSATVNSGSLGYGTGSGGTVTQLTSKSTSVTLNKTNGQIVTHDASLGAGETVAFAVSNSTVAATDTVIAILQSVPATAHTVLDYQIWAGTVAAGNFFIAIKNQTAGAIAEAITINFAVIKAVTA